MMSARQRNRWQRAGAIAWLGAALTALGAVPAQARTAREVAQLIGSEAAASDQAGFSVALDGNTAVVGAPRHDSAGPIADTGVAYVYVRDGSGNWTQQQVLRDAALIATDRFGEAVAISGDTIAI